MYVAAVSAEFVYRRITLGKTDVADEAERYEEARKEAEEKKDEVKEDVGDLIDKLLEALKETVDKRIDPSPLRVSRPRRERRVDICSGRVCQFVRVLLGNAWTAGGDKRCDVGRRGIGRGEDRDQFAARWAQGRWRRARGSGRDGSRRMVADAVRLR